MTTPRERMLAAIRAGINTNRAFLEAEMQKAPHTPPPHVHPPADDLQAQFVEEAQRAGAFPYICADAEAALDAIQKILSEHGANSALTWDFAQIDLPGLEALLNQMQITRLDTTVTVCGETQAQRVAHLHAIEHASVGISGADLGIAESGTLAVMTGPGRGRLTTLFAPLHIAVLPASRLVRGLGAAFDALRHQYGSDIFAEHANLTLITGPSRTGDIEMTLTTGVHGPGELHIIVLNEEEAA
ncbi:MAG: LUD domain-containing protein [Chloroflexaceae bacterium]|nr:LUD domain-containing protein [Chloroflexaceae bacterium]